MFSFLDNYCVQCHNAEKDKGDVRLDQLALRVTDENHEVWQEPIPNIQRGDMPPRMPNSPMKMRRACGTP